ncbi:MAG: hypothetical protein A2X23_00865 [Chloroflexi bacterium GWC2_73_18]|nr:MAG: hypothetical protein A2X23_00865 [Chloroflexi bacterium GWC2_73_18]
MTISILLAEDHHVVRQGLRALLEAEPGLRLIGEAADGPQAARLVELLRPDVLVLDLVLPGLPGLEVLRLAARRSPRTRVVILSMHADPAYVSEALQAGARAYLLKESTADELLHAIREVAAGRTYLGPPLSDEAVVGYRQRAQAAGGDPYQLLTPREREVFHLAAEGLSASVIAARLVIGRRTAETHLANLMRKLGLRGRAELVRYAFRRGVARFEE